MTVITATLISVILFEIHYTLKIYSQKAVFLSNEKSIPEATSLQAIRCAQQLCTSLLQLAETGYKKRSLS